MFRPTRSPPPAWRYQPREDIDSEMSAESISHVPIQRDKIFESPKLTVFTVISYDQSQLGGDARSGKVKLKVEPLPTSLSTQIFPPCNSTNFLAKVNPRPVPFPLVSVVAPHLAKLLEDLCLVLRRDADPRVTDRNLHGTVSLTGLNADPAPLRGELHGIG